MSEYIDAAVAAKMIRQLLKSKFPKTKFSVRTDKYSGGASIDIGWMDGPTAKEVDVLVAPFKGASFDGMIDMEISNSSYILPDGSVTFGPSPGTEGSMGVIPASKPAMPEGARAVHFGSKYIFTNRRVSPENIRKVVDELATKFGDFKAEDVVIEAGYRGEGHIKNGWKIPVAGVKGWDSYWNLETQANITLAERSF